MNNDNDLNLHSMTRLSGWLRYCDFVFGDHVMNEFVIYIVKLEFLR